MNQSEFSVVVDQTIDSIQNLLRVKGGEYAGSEDRLANFKRGAALTGATSLQVLFVYLSKHYDAIATYVRDDAAKVTRERSEPIDGRLDDIINYCLLAKALIREQRETAHVQGLNSVIAGSINLDRSDAGYVGTRDMPLHSDRVLDSIADPIGRIPNLPRKG